MLAVLFPVAALVALYGLAAVALHDVPRTLGTVALITTLAALAVAILH